MTDKYVKKAEKEVKVKGEEHGPRGPCFTISKGLITTTSIKYKLHAEGKKILTDFFTEKMPAKDSDKDRLRFKEMEAHPHPVGAMGRAFLSDLVYYKYETNAIIYEPSVSKIRLYNRTDFDGKELSNRVYSSTSLIDSRDIIRERNNRRRMEHDLLNHCSNECRLSSKLVVCKNKICDQDYEVVLGTENIYYPGVLEGMCNRIRAKKGTGYAVFNDYHASLLVKGAKGLCADGESSYLIEGSKVTSTVVGNYAPYEHGFLNTGGQMSWQYKISLPKFDGDGMEDVYVLFEVLETLLNKDVPMRLVKFYTVSVDEFREVGSEGGFENVVAFDTIFYEHKDPEVSTDVSMTTSEEITVKAPIEVTKTTRQGDSEVTKLQDAIVLTELGGKKSIKQGQLQLNLSDRKQTPYHGWDGLEFIIRQFKESSEKLFVNDSEGKSYLNLELYESNWLGLKTRTKHLRAEVSVVAKAYHKIATKQLVSTIDNACAAAQRELEKEMDFSQTLNFPEAFAIARIMRAQQTQRLIKTLNASTSVDYVKKNSK